MEREHQAPLPVVGVAHRVVCEGHPFNVWEKSAEKPKRTVVLLHGRTWSGRPDFDLQVPGESRSLMDELVANGYSTFAVDLRGYGGTPRDSSGWLSPDRAVRDVAAILEWVAENDRVEQSPILFGWSLGATLAQLCAQRSPEKLSDLILFGYWYDSEKPIPVAVDPAEPPRLKNTPQAASSDFITPEVVTQLTVDAYVEACLKADPVRVDWRSLHEFNALDPSRVRVPTLLIQGELDPLAQTKAHATLFSKLGHPDRQWIVLPQGGHAALLEDTLPAFVAAVVAFLERPRLE